MGPSCPFPIEFTVHKALFQHLQLGPRKFRTPSDSYQMLIWAILAIVWFIGKLGAQISILIGKILFITAKISKWSEVRTFVVLFSICLGAMQGLPMQSTTTWRKKQILFSTILRLCFRLCHFCHPWFHQWHRVRWLRCVIRRIWDSYLPAIPSAMPVNKKMETWAKICLHWKFICNKISESWSTGGMPQRVAWQLTPFLK